MLTPMGEWFFTALGVEVATWGVWWSARPRHRRVKVYGGNDPWHKPVPTVNPDFPGYGGYTPPADTTGDWTPGDDDELKRWLNDNT